MNENYSRDSGQQVNAYPRNGGGTLQQPTVQPVTGAVQLLDNEVGALHEVIIALEQRLSSLLAPLPPQSVGENTAKLARHSLAMQIEAGASGVRMARDRIGSLLSRLEL